MNIKRSLTSLPANPSRPKSTAETPKHQAGPDKVSKPAKTSKSHADLPSPEKVRNALQKIDKPLVKHLSQSIQPFLSQLSSPGTSSNGPDKQNDKPDDRVLQLHAYVHQNFARLDGDGNGFLSRQELTQAIEADKTTPQERAALWQLKDQIEEIEELSDDESWDENQGITLQDMDGLKQEASQSPDSELIVKLEAEGIDHYENFSALELRDFIDQAGFEMLDTNQNGFLSPAELKKGLARTDFTDKERSMVFRLLARIESLEDSHDDPGRDNRGISRADLATFLNAGQLEASREGLFLQNPSRGAARGLMDAPWPGDTKTGLFTKDVRYQPLPARPEKLIRIDIQPDQSKIKTYDLNGHQVALQFSEDYDPQKRPNEADMLEALATLPTEVLQQINTVAFADEPLDGHEQAAMSAEERFNQPGHLTVYPIGQEVIDKEEKSTRENFGVIRQKSKEELLGLFAEKLKTPPQELEVLKTQDLPKLQSLFLSQLATRNSTQKLREEMHIHLLHEVGHTLSVRQWQDDPRAWQAWQTATEQDMFSPSAYARNNLREDFAETFRVYVETSQNPEKREEYRQIYPHRFQVLETLLQTQGIENL